MEMACSLLQHHCCISCCGGSYPVKIHRPHSTILDDNWDKSGLCCCGAIDGCNRHEIGTTCGPTVNEHQQKSGMTVGALVHVPALTCEDCSTFHLEAKLKRTTVSFPTSLIRSMIAINCFIMVGPDPWAAQFHA